MQGVIAQANRVYDEMTATLTRAIIAAVIGIALLVAGIASFSGTIFG